MAAHASYNHMSTAHTQVNDPSGLHNFHILPHMCLIAHIYTQQLIKFLPTSVDEKNQKFRSEMKFLPTSVDEKAMFWAKI